MTKCEAHEVFVGWERYVVVQLLQGPGKGDQHSHAEFDIMAAVDRNWFGRVCSAVVVAAIVELLPVCFRTSGTAAVSASAKEQRSATSTSAAKAASAWP